MAIILNDNIKINAGKPSESKYLNTSNLPYSGSTIAAALNAVTTAIPISERYLGLTVLVTTGGTYNTEYWFKTDVNTLIEKKFASEQVVGDFITGATNLGYFSGQTGIQTLDLVGFPMIPVDFNGYYYSEYNWYYVDADGIVRLGSPIYGGALRRAYVDNTRTKSWIYSVSNNKWMLANIDVAANVGQVITLYDYTGTYTNTVWNPFQSNGSTAISAIGSLTTGSTLTIGNPIYRDKSNQELHLRTIINDTPEFLKIEADDNFIHFSGVSSVITGTNYGTGVGVFSGKTGSDLKFRTLVPSGNTTITTVGDNIVINSTGGGGGGDGVFTENIVVTLSGGNSFGK